MKRSIFLSVALALSGFVYAQNTWVLTFRRVWRTVIVRESVARNNMADIPAKTTVTSRTCINAAPLLFFNIIQISFTAR